MGTPSSLDPKFVWLILGQFGLSVAVLGLLPTLGIVSFGEMPAIAVPEIAFEGLVGSFIALGFIARAILLRRIDYADSSRETFGRFVTYHVVVFACFEAAAVSGFVGYFLTHDLKMAQGAAGAALISMVVAWPTRRLASAQKLAK